MSRSDPSHPRELLPWLVNGTLEPNARREVEEHMRSCLACRREVEELRELRREVKQQAPAPPDGGLGRLLQEVQGAPGTRESGRERPDRRDRAHKTGHRAWRPVLPVWVPALVAATVVLAVGLGVWRPWNVEDPPPVQERAGETADALRSALGPEEALPRDAFVLDWEVGSSWEGARFSVTVTRDDLTLVAEAHGLEETHFEVSAEALASLPTGARLFWRVEAVRPDDARRAEVFTARLEEEAP